MEATPNPRNDELVQVILDILKRGNSAEVKKEKDNIVVVEIKRQVRVKRPL